MKPFFAVIYWQHSKFIWKSQQLGLQLSWYGLLFALGIFIDCLLGLKLALRFYDFCDSKEVSKGELEATLEKFALYSLPFIIIGARLAYVLFYGGDFYFRYPQEIFKIWRGGLASHGGIVAMFLWIFLFSRHFKKRIPFMTFIFLCDLCCSVCGFGAFCIRLGNLINQEIVGRPTTLPWGIVFSDPVQGQIGIPVHPVQMYEGISYLCLAICLYGLNYYRKLTLGTGSTTSIALVSIALIRFFAEYFKSHQGHLLQEESLFSMGQLLSLPVFIFGVIFGIRAYLLRK